MFLESCGEVIRVLCGNEEGNWVISYDNPCTPKFVLRDDLRTMERIEPPKDFQMRMTQEQTPGQKKRQELISDLLEEESYVWDRTGRNTKIREIAARVSRNANDSRWSRCFCTYDRMRICSNARTFGYISDSF